MDLVSISMSCLIMWLATAAANITWTWPIRLTLSIILALLINGFSNVATFHAVDDLNVSLPVRLALTSLAMYIVGLPLMMLMREQGKRLSVRKAHFAAIIFAVASIAFVIIRHWGHIDWSH
jgi:hypothetical protein